MESYVVNNYMMRSRGEHLRHAAGSVNRSKELPHGGLAAAARAVLAGLMNRSGRALVDAGSTLQRHAAFIREPAHPRQKRAA
jgi:hypothetical protein